MLKHSRHMRSLRNHHCTELEREEESLYGAKAQNVVFRTHLKHSLMKLDFIHNYTSLGDRNPRIGSMQGYQVLTHVRLHKAMLFTPVMVPDRYPVALVDRLPASVEYIALAGRINWTGVRDLLEGLPELKRDRLPHLREIFFETSTNVDESLRCACARYGIQIIT